jgi:Ca2+-binding EF-hand superfamily protein
MGQGQGKRGNALSRSEVRELKRHVSFSEEEIVDWYKDFQRRSRNMGGDSQFLSEDEFVKVFNSVYTTGNSEQFAKHVFRTFDTNGDGKLDFREFMIGMSVSASTDQKKLLSWAFKLYDVDNTGYIDRDEMTEIIQVSE